MELLWYFNPSLGADYGEFICESCGQEFNYSPRLACHCNRCAINELEDLIYREKDVVKRLDYLDALHLLRKS